MKENSEPMYKAALPTVCRGLRELYGMSSIREFSRISSLSASIISRTERGLIMPSTDALYRWSTGLADGRPNPERWTTTIYAAAATWPTEPQFMLVRYADQRHDPEVIWRVAVQAADLTAYMINNPSVGTQPVINTFVERGAARFPRFVSSIRSKAVMDALRASWFDVFCRSNPETLSNIFDLVPRVFARSSMFSRPATEGDIPNITAADKKSLKTLGHSLGISLRSMPHSRRTSSVGNGLISNSGCEAPFPVSSHSGRTLKKLLMRRRDLSPIRILPNSHREIV